jgi:hypothetical protein
VFALLKEGVGKVWMAMWLELLGQAIRFALFVPLSQSLGAMFKFY